MPRRNYVVTYDIADDKRRTAVFKGMHGYGDHVQYSVFLCEMSDTEVVQLKSWLRRSIQHDEDQVLIVDLGRASRAVEAGIDVVGKPYQPPVRSLVI